MPYLFALNLDKPEFSSHLCLRLMKYFGTDGIRGEYKGEFINEIFFERLGRAASTYLRRIAGLKCPRIAIAGDPRFSSESLKMAFCRGACGCEIFDFTCIPTPALAFGTLQMKADLGVMITASHNPCIDNGIKFFDSKARKISDEAQDSIEQIFDSGDFYEGEVPQISKVDMRRRYIDKMESILPENSLAGIRIVLDTANGATCGISSEVLRHYGAEVLELGNSPDGRNINENIGSEHPEMMCELVKKSKAFVGLAHDGDGDRLVVCDENGNKIAGECVMGLVAIEENQAGKLKNNGIATTVQSNIGMDESLAHYGIKVFRSGVGDRLVMQKILENDLAMGGENSGHYIFMDISPCGDGLAAAVKLLATVLEKRIKISDISSVVSLYPSISKAVKVLRKTPIKDTENLSKAIAVCESKLGKRGRVLVRYSGTENKIRLLVEGESPSANQDCMKLLLKNVEIDLQ